jgi:hypothetical protein
MNALLKVAKSIDIHIVDRKKKEEKEARKKKKIKAVKVECFAILWHFFFSSSFKKMPMYEIVESSSILPSILFKSTDLW